MSIISTKIKWGSISNWMSQWAAFLHSTMIKWDNISNWMIRWDSISYWMIQRDSISYWMMKWSRDTAESVLSRGTKRRREIEDDLRKERQLFSIIVELCALKCSVADPWHFATDPDPWIRTSDSPIRIHIRILLFSSVTFKTATKNYINFFCLLLFEATFT